MRIPSAFLLLLAITPAGVGMTWRSGVGATSVGTCALITREEAATAAGATVPAGVEQTLDVPMLGRTIKLRYCFYGAEVVLAQFDLGTTAPALFTQYRESLNKNEDYEVLTGIGEEAFHAKGQIAIRKGQTGLIVDVGQNRGGGADELRKEKGLASLAIGRM